MVGTLQTIHRPTIDDTAQRYQLDADLLEAQMIIESSGRPDAFAFEAAFYQRYVVGKHLPYSALGPLAACSYGLLQILFAVAYELGFRGRPEDLFVPAVGLDLGARKLRQLVDWAAGDVEQALCAYNGGTAHNCVRPFAQQAYADRVFAEKERTA